ncbi:MAG TPA: TIGR04283 family arsenosugar biosynthesis glycosyltransferase [Gallionellaceae bacterium]|nr:TIGR04283 family arsenosugar biosynthesis glycosyltransferase [Gallionellaceae bacterium]
MRRISVIIPALNEAANISGVLQALAPLRSRGHEVIVVDGGSSDGTPALAAPLADRVLHAQKGRALQMNAGARAAKGDVLWFLHADTLPPPDADKLILAALAQGGRVWGHFDVRLSGAGALLRMVAFMMNRRSRLSGIATGDQGIFVLREVFERAGGFPEIPLMEDIALSRALKKYSRPAHAAQGLVTSSRRWEQRGVWRTILLMWRLRLAYFFGADPHKLGGLYGECSTMRFPVARLMIFAKAPVAGAAKTRLAPLLGAQGAADLHARLTERILHTAVSANLAPVELWCSPDCSHPFFQAVTGAVGRRVQHGEDLGERMANAFEAALACQPYAVLVGTDCPAMTADYLRQAFVALDGGADAVIGPAEDGGYMLIGLRRLDKRLFEGVTWSSDRVLAETRERLAALGWRWHELETLWDVDRPEDMKRLACSIPKQFTRMGK